MIKDNCFDEICLNGYNLWMGQKISEMEDSHQENIYNMILASCKQFGVEMKSSEKFFDSRDGWNMNKEWLEKYAYGFIKEIEQYWE